MKDYYKVLGVDKNASEDEIKKAYRKLAHQYHPDKSGGDEARFKEIGEAYQILSSKEKRVQYDRHGATGDPFQHGGFHSQGFGNGGFGFHAEDFADLNDIFSAFFEGVGGQKRKTYRRGADLEFVQEITLEEAFRGTTKTISFPTFIACETCEGKGAELSAGTEQCTSCGGHGEVRETKQTFFGNFAKVRTCEKCHGTGEMAKKVCATCKGGGRIRGERKASVDIRPGIADNQIIKAGGSGEAGEQGAETGDLYIRIRVAPHKIFQRQGDDLLIAKEITPFDILLGREMQIPIIDGTKKTIIIPSGFNLRKPFAIANEGMPRLSGRGRGGLLVVFTIITPKRLNKKAQELLAKAEKET